MADHPEDAGIFRTAALSTKHPTSFSLSPDGDARARLARELGIEGIRKLSFAGTLVPVGRRGWRLEAKLGATVVQSCVVTLAPVTTRIDESIDRRFEPVSDKDAPEAGSETEMPEDDTFEPLGETINASAVMAEALALALPAYPRVPDAELERAAFAEPGVAPMSDEDVKPFAGLAGLRDKLKGEE